MHPSFHLICPFLFSQLSSFRNASLASLTAPPPPQPCLLPSRNEFRRRARFCFEWSLGNPSLPRSEMLHTGTATKISPKVLPSSNRSVVAVDVEKGRLHTHTHTHTHTLIVGKKRARSVCLSLLVMPAPGSAPRRAARAPALSRRGIYSK